MLRAPGTRRPSLASATCRPRLASAQLVLARERGYPNWPTLVREIAEQPSRTDLDYYEGRAYGIATVNGTSLAAARRALAHRHGLAGWSELTCRVQALASGEEPPTPFMLAYRAVEDGDLERLRALLDERPELVLQRGTNGNDLFGMAGDLDVVRLLLGRSADVNRGHDYGWTKLHQAGYRNDVRLAELLLGAGARTDLYARGDGGTTDRCTLLGAPRGRRAARARAAQPTRRSRPRSRRPDRRARPHACGRSAPRLLPPARRLPGLAAFRRSAREILDEALVWAAKSDRVEAIERLVEFGADLDADPYRGTPLTWAAVNGRVASIRRLVRLGADVNRRGTFGGPDHGQGVTALPSRRANPVSTTRWRHSSSSAQTGSSATPSTAGHRQAGHSTAATPSSRSDSARRSPPLARHDTTSPPGVYGRATPRAGACCETRAAAVARPAACSNQPSDQGGQMLRKRASLAVLATVVVSAVAAATAGADGSSTATPIKHLVVIFQENVSFDHYFGTYPTAANTDGQPFLAPAGTPAVDGLTPATDSSIPASLRHSSDLTTSNPNTSLPARFDSTPLGKPLGPGGQLTCDQDHNYSDEQQAFDGGAMDQFVQSVGGTSNPPPGVTCKAAQVMDYYDGNTVTGFWNYAKRFAMSDNSFSPTFGPSSPGAVNLVSGDTGDVGIQSTDPPASSLVTIATSAKPNADLTPDGLGGYSLTSDAQPYWDDCSTRDAVGLDGQNIGDALNTAGLSWGWFQGGFRPTVDYQTALHDVGADGQPTSTFVPDQFSSFFANAANRPLHSTNQGNCDNVSPIGVALGVGGSEGFKDDYIPHHEPFQYYVSTANPHHIAPASLSAIGTDTQHYIAGVPQFDTANHQYDITDFDSLVAAINGGTLPAAALPAVSFLKAPGYEDGHAQYSDPADEQQFVVREINSLEASPDWSSTAVIVAYDDSDGWYDHVYSGVTNPSASVADNLTNSVLKPNVGTSGLCGNETPSFQPLAGEQGRCGFGPRQPFLVISPCASGDTVDHNLSDLASVPNFIEYNWHLPAISGSFDQALAGVDQSEKAAFDIAGLFDFKCKTDSVKLDPSTGQVDDRGANLSGKNMQGADVSGAELNNADLNGANLQRSFDPNAILTGASAKGANLQNADLAGIEAQNADFEGANLQKSNMTNANLAGANLTGANINNVTWSNTTCPDGTNSNADGGTCKGHV